MASANAQGTLFSSDASGNLTTASSGSISTPQIIGQPQRQVVEPGKTATFSVVVADSQGVTYQWRLNNNPIGGATNDALIITNVTAANEGSYSVVVTNSSGNAISNSAALMIDSDGDGLGDSWEIQYFGNLTKTASDDVDGDTISNLDEFLDGTDPTAAGSVRPRLTLLTDGGGTVSASPTKLSYEVGENVTITATAFAPNTFHGWAGDVTGLTNPTNVIMNANKTVTARFIGSELPPGLVGWWRAENDAQDALGVNNGALANGTTFATGEVGQAFNLNGTNQSVDIPDSPSLRPTSVTLEAWVMFSSTTGIRQIFAKPLGSGALDSFAMWYDTGNLYGGISDNTVLAQLSTAFSPALGSWHHLAYTYDATTRQQILYIDGVAAATNNALRSIRYDAQPVLLGRDIQNGSPNYFFAGEIDEAAIFSRALTANEIKTIYLSDIAGKRATTPYFTSDSQLPEVPVGNNYSQQLSAALGTGPYNFFVTDGTLPTGISVSLGGLISGTPTIGGLYSFTVTVIDSIGSAGQQTFNLRVSKPVMVPSLISWWRAEDNGQDSIGTNHGTLENGITFSNGKVGHAFNLDGLNDSVLLPTINAGSAFSVELWLYPTNQGLFDLVSNDYSSITNYGALYFNNDHIEYWQNSSSKAATPANSIPLNTWSHVVLTYDGDVNRIYINGSLAATGTSHLETFNNPLRFGYAISFGGHFQGLLDEVSLYRRDLNTTEVASLYGAGSAGKITTGPYLNTFATLPSAILNQAYSQPITAARGTSPLIFAITGGTVPNGVTLSSGGLLSGTPTQSGTFTFTVRVTDAANLFTDQLFTLRIYARPAPLGGIISWWRAENDAQDAIGTNHGTVTNGTTFAAGKVGQAFALNGSNQSIDVPDSPSLRPASLTVEGWVMFTGTGKRQIFGKPLGSGSLDSFAIWYEFGILNAAIADNTGTGNILSYSWTPAFGRFYHIAYTFDDVAKQQVLYIDGSQVASGFTNKTIGYDTSPFLIGRDQEFGNASYYFPGRIDEVALYNRPLGPAEIGIIANAGPAGRTVVGPYFNNPSDLPDAIALTPYSQNITTSRGTGQVLFSVVGGSLPPGLGLNSAGLLSGTPTTTGTFSFVLRATDVNNQSADQTFTLRVLPRVSPPAGIISWWRAENNAQDSIGTNHGTLINGATFGVGKVNQAFSVNGNSEYVSVPDATALRPASLTVEAWVNFFSNASLQAIVGKGLTNGGADSYIIWYDSNFLHAYIGDATGGTNQINAAFVPVIGRWYHIAFTFDNLTKEQWLYIDGVAVATGISNRAIGYDTNALLIGGDRKSGNPTWFFNGRIDEAAIYNRALSPAEIGSLFNVGSAGRTTTGPYIDTPPQLPDGALNANYSQAIISARGNGQVTYSLVSGSLPAGMSLTSVGLLSGTPSAAGDFSFVVRATDGAGLFGDQSFSLHIYSPARTPIGLVSWWRAENDAQDSAGPNHGSLVNGATFAAGKVGQAFSFDGIDDYVSVPDSVSLRPTSLSIEAWVQFNTVPIGLKKFVSKSLGVNGLDSYALWWDTGVLKGGVGDTGGFGTTVNYNLAPVIGHWYHFVYTFDNVTKQQVLYVDGLTAVIGQGSKSAGFNTQPLYIAADFGPNSLTYFFPGQIDEASIYNRAITAQEVNAVYNAKTAGKRFFFPLETWKLTNLGDPDAPDSGDADKDGLSNLLEYGINTNPAAANQAPVVTLQTNGDGSKHLVVSLTRDPTRNDITILVQSSGDLLNPQNWTTIATSINGSAFSGTATITGEVAGTAPRVVTIVDPNTGNKRFVRIQVTH